MTTNLKLPSMIIKNDLFLVTIKNKVIIKNNIHLQLNKTILMPGLCEMMYEIYL